MQRRSRLTALVTAATSVSLSLTLAAGPAQAAAPDPVKPDPAVKPLAPVAPAGRPPTTAELQKALQVLTKAGAVGAVGRVTTTSYGVESSVSAAAGAFRLGPRKPAQPGMRFRAASMTKMFTAVLAFQMIEQGRWSLGTTINQVSPGLLPKRGGITVGQLLSQRSGLIDYATPLVVPAGSNLQKFLKILRKKRTAASLIKFARRLPVIAKPGKKFNYANTNYLVLGALLERANGTPLASQMATRVFAPAGMTASSYDVTPKIRGSHLREYGRWPGKRKPFSLRGFQPTLFSGAGALVTTVADLDRFHRALSTGRLISARSVAIMRSAVSPAKPIVYGYGSYRTPDPCTKGGWVYGHDGASFGTYTQSFSSADGSRRVTIAMTGRSYRKKAKDLATMTVLRDALLATTCSTSQSGGGAPSPAPPGGPNEPTAAPVG